MSGTRIRHKPTSCHTVLIVDGYNIIGAWPKLRQLVQQSALDLARIQLVELLSSYVAFREYQARVVFDAYAQPAPARQEQSPSGIDVFYTAFGETADTWIERVCAQLQWEECRVRVATSDRLQQLVVGGYDAEWISAQHLLSEVRQAQEQIRRTKPRSTPKIERGLGNLLDPSVQNRLNHWRITGKDPAQG